MKKIVTIALLCTLIGGADSLEARGWRGGFGWGFGAGLGLGYGYPYRYGYGRPYYGYGWGGYPYSYGGYDAQYYDYYRPRRPQYSAPYAQYTTVTNSAGQTIYVEFEDDGNSSITRTVRPNDHIQVRGRIISIRSEDGKVISIQSHRSQIEVFLDSKGQLHIQ